MIKIRKMEYGDLAAVKDLINQLARDLNEVFIVDELNVTDQYNEMDTKVNEYYNVVACIEEKIIGFCSLLMYKSFFHINGSAQINELIVSNEFRHNGVGTDLLQHMIKYAQELKLDEIEVGVMKNNNIAIDFYYKNEISEEYLLLGREL